MHPYLLEWSTQGILYRLPSYGVFLAMAFTLGYLYALWKGEKVGLKARDIEALFLLALLCSLLGSRLFHVVFEDWSHYAKAPWKILYVWEGGYTFYGGVIPALAVILFYCYLRKLAFLRVADLASVCCALGLGLGRIGCFLAGCCWGSPSHVPWAVSFSHSETFSGLRNVPVHPTQLYESLLGFGIFLLLQRRLERNRPAGEAFLIGLALYSVGRFCIEFFRADEYRGFVLGGVLSFSQFISLAIFPLVLCAFFSLRKQVTRE